MTIQKRSIKIRLAEWLLTGTGYGVHKYTKAKGVKRWRRPKKDAPVGAPYNGEYVSASALGVRAASAIAIEHDIHRNAQRLKDKHVASLPKA